MMNNVALKPVTQCRCCGLIHDLADLPKFLGPEMMGLLLFNCQCGSTLAIYAQFYRDFLSDHGLETQEYLSKVD